MVRARVRVSNRFGTLTLTLTLPLTPTPTLTRCFMVSTASFYSMLGCIDRMLGSTQVRGRKALTLP